MADWLVWPIFIVQVFILIIILFGSKRKKYFGLHTKTIALGLLLLICLVIILSLKHDAFDPLTLYF